MMWRSRAEKERALMWCLHRAPDGLYAPELSRLTGIGRGTVYIYLGRLEEAGIVKMVPDGGEKIQRILYFAADVHVGCPRHIGAKHPACPVCYPNLTIPQLNAQYERIMGRE